MTNELICTPVMLPAYEKVVTQLHTVGSSKTIRLSKEGLNMDICNPQHLYLVLNAQIKEGEFFYDKTYHLTSGDIRRARWDTKDKNLFNIIASTDKSLSLPIIPSSFIEEYVAKQGKIDKVRLEIQPGSNNELVTCSSTNGDEWFETVMILPIEDKTYSREEVLDLMTMAIMNDNCSMPYTVAELKEEFPYQFDQKISNVKEWFDKHY